MSTWRKGTGRSPRTRHSVNVILTCSLAWKRPVNACILNLRESPVPPDEDIRGGVVRGLQRREASVDILDVNTGGLKGTEDGALLELANDQRRVLVSCDRNTMVAAFWERLGRGLESAGLCIFPQDCPVGAVIEELVMVWAASAQEEWRNRLEFLPYR